MEAIKQSKTQHNAYSAWTPDEEEELLRLLETDMTQKEIGFHLKRTAGAISSRKAKLQSPSVFVAKSRSALSRASFSWLVLLVEIKARKNVKPSVESV